MAHSRFQKGAIDLREGIAIERESGFVVRKTGAKNAPATPKFVTQGVGSIQKERRVFTILSSSVAVCAMLFLMMSSLFRFALDAKTAFASVKQEDIPQIQTLLAQGDVLQIETKLQSIREKIGNIKAQLPLSLRMVQGDDQLLSQASYIFDAGDEILAGLTEATPLLYSMHQFLQDFSTMELSEVKKKYASLTTFLRYHWKAYWEHVYPHFVLADQKLAHVQEDVLPEQYRHTLHDVKSFVKLIVYVSEEGDRYFPSFLALLGEDYPKTYVVLFQNSGEMRATGGFIGSIARFKINDGWIEYLEFKDVYDIDGEFVGNVPPPPGIEQITSNFRLRDANYWPDFPTSARQIKWFMDKDKGASIDGVFAITDQSVENIVRVLGGVSVPGIQDIVPPEMFPHLLSFIVENKFTKTEPKQIIFALGEKLLEKLKKELPQKPELFRLFLQEVQEKRVLMFAVDENVQKMFKALGVDGEMQGMTADMSQGIDDYLLIAHTNIGGNKSDRFMEEKVSHHTKVGQDGQVVVKTSLSRRHTWSSDVSTHLKTFLTKVTGKKVLPYIEYILGNGPNKQYMRFFVPKGAKIIGTEGIPMQQVTTFQDLGKTVFAFPSEVQQGKKETYTIEYVLPENIVSSDATFAYHMLFEKEPGGRNIPVEQTWDVPPSFVRIADADGKKPLSTVGSLDTFVLQHATVVSGLFHR